jgi:hypothetical protein
MLFPINHDLGTHRLVCGRRCMLWQHLTTLKDPSRLGQGRFTRLRVISGIICVIRNGLQLKVASRGLGAHKTLYNRFVRWSRLGVFSRICTRPGRCRRVPERLMIDATSRCIAPRQAGCTRGARPRSSTSAAMARAALWRCYSQRAAERSQGRALGSTAGTLGDCGHDSNGFRAALKRDIAPCIPSNRFRKIALPYDKALHRRTLFRRLQYWHRIAVSYDRSSRSAFSALCIAASLTF